ncbi:MAG TPA: SDR family NAD(P)-dependent oxidoreductase [Bosea sp. (in: a-proteobacteria)]|jgi:NAD(P)-dependent dehydrogenase (short-subunit alcohol dehydrogenase family)|uniref:SDR family NAD(P)-dependent oxidoreductase n=1 Tax=Bosea sp. (in: a-proteobacteria) TaxID=1871050 RepID=UPI002DDCB8A1|nr:SDR family NAD(P)-dependent oxidoreductase [Bosea sp. (in: a-proteobacteria)]HEV2555086.1 SDR family NAD(P)-dependent oxidoreductase [Bosea sp. (in: a-proteobacteria)]
MTKVAMISGASRGIGWAIAEKLGRQGIALSLAIRNPALAPGDWLAPAGMMSFAYQATDPRSERAWVEATMARFGRIDILVNAAGILRNVSLADGTEEDLDAMLAVNLKAPFRLIQAALPHLRVSGHGRVVNVASLSGKRVRNGNAGYQMSKFAMVALSHAVRQAAFADGVRSVALCPGYVATDMTAQAPVPQEEMTRPEDLARLVALIIQLPNTASISELAVNCAYEAMF